MTGVSETAAVSQNPVVFDIFEQRLKASALKQTLAVLPEADRDQLVDQIEDLARRLDTLVEATQKVRERLSYDVLLTRLISLITEAFDADRSSLFLFDAESKELFARVAQGDLVSEIRFPCDRGIAGSVFQSGEPAIVDDAYDDPRFNPAVDVDTGFRTRNILCVPVRTRSGDIIGVTEVLNTNKGRFTNADSVLLQAFTTHTAAAIETAHFGQIARESQREEAHIMEVTQAVSSELNIEKLLRKIISIATDLLEAERSTLFLHDPTTDELWSRVAEGMDEREIRIPSTIGIAGEVFSTRTSVNIPDAYTDGRFNQEVDKKTGFRTRSILCVPVINKHGIAIGVVQVLNRRGGPFRLRDQRRLEMLAAQSAIALDNARLFREVLDERNYSENVLRSLSDAVITLDNACNIVKVNKAACTILHTRADVILGAPADSVFSGPNQWVLDSVGKVMQRNEADASLDVSLHTLNGHTVSINLNVTPLTDTEGASLGCTMIMEDLTEEKRIRTTMARYMNTKIVDQVLAEGESALEGRLQNATILFSDIKDFTAIAERVGPQETVSVLNEYFTEMVEVVFAYNGILDKYIGDAIMAVFGPPFPSSSDADNAVRVAIRMQAVLRDLNARRARVGQPQFEIRIGINSGDVVAGSIGSTRRADYTVIGDGVNIAARLESANKQLGTAILISGSTQRALTGEYRLRELDLIRVKGKQEPLPVFEVMGDAAHVSSNVQSDLLREFSHGLASYRERDWTRAVERFSAALALDAHDGPSMVFKQRAAHYLASPPPDSWDGVWTLNEK